MDRGFRRAKGLKNRDENKDDVVKLDFNLEPSLLMQEILSNICQRYGISSVKKLNYLNAFVHLLNKDANWKSPDTFSFTTDEILSCLRIALIQDSVQVRAVGLRALRYVIRNEEDVLLLNRLHFPYLIARSLDLLLKTDNERVLMSERIQSLKMMRHILSVAPQHFSAILVRPLISVALRPIEETDRLLKACIAVLCELCILNCAVFVECDGVRALLRNATIIPSSHIVEAICGALLFILNKPSMRDSAKVDLCYLISGYTNSVVTEKNSFREEERRLTWTNFALLTMLRSCSGIFELCDKSRSGLKSIVLTLYLNKTSIRKAILELLYELINIPQPEFTDDENAALESVELSRYLESFKLSEGFLVAEGKHYLPTLSKNRVNLVEVHTALLLICLLEAGLPDALVEVIVSSEASVSLNAAILLGELLNLIRKLLPIECYVLPPSLPNLVSYAVRGCPLVLPGFTSLSKDTADTLSSELYEQYSSSFSHYSKDFHYVNDSTTSLRYSGDISKTLDGRQSFLNMNVPDNCTRLTQNVAVVTEDKKRLSLDVTEQNCIDDPVSHLSADTSSTAGEQFRRRNKSKLRTDASFFKRDNKNQINILNKNNVDLPPCKKKQRMALSAVSVLSSLQKKFDKPCQPASLLLSCVAQYGELSQNKTADDLDDKNPKKNCKKVSLKELEELIKDTGILIVPDASRWKWKSIRILLRLSFDNLKSLNDANFKLLLKRLVQFYKPSSKKYSHTPLKFETSRINIYTLVACDLFNILLDSRINDGVKLLLEFLEDFDSQLKQIVEGKSVHDCLLSPQRLSNTLSQDYFLLLGLISNSDTGSLLLEKCNILQNLHHIATNINLDCYVKLIISSLSYVNSQATRKLYSSVLSCNYVSSRLYATKFLQVLLRIRAWNHEDFCNWLIEMLVNQLYDDNQTIAMVALNALNEAADNKEYLDVLITLRPSLLHLGDTGLLLLIRFLSTEKGFSYLQAANFVAPQLQRWANSFNMKYTQIVEGELHDALSQYQRGDDGRYRKRITGGKAKLKDVIVPPHLYGQLVQHSPGFTLLLKQENVRKLIEVILISNYDTDKAIVELKSALWAMGHFATSSVGAKYLSDHGVVKAVVTLAEKATVYSVKMTAFFVISLIATTKEGVDALNVTGWKSLKRNRHESYFAMGYPFAAVSLDKLFYDDDSDTVLSSTDLESPQEGVKTLIDHEDDNLMLKILSKFSFDKKIVLLPQRSDCSSQIIHNRSLSESKADASDDWSSSGSPPSNIQKYIPEINRSAMVPVKQRTDSCGTDSSTSGISSCDSVYGKPSNFNERISTLSPIPSSSSLNTVMTNIHQKEHRTFLSKRHSSISFGCRLTAQNNLGYKTLRMLQNRHQLSNCPMFSASATMEYLSAPERRQMSPLVRPKFPRYIQKLSTPEFEIKNAPFHISGNESMNISSTIESSHFSHSTEIDEGKSEFNGPCYQGICLPLRLSYLLPQPSNNIRHLVSDKKIAQQIGKSRDDADLSGESDSDQLKYDDANFKFSSTQKKRRHDKSACILCSLRTNIINDVRNTMRSRRTSTSSVHRIRTETESSYGGGVGPETDSPILLTWQQKPVGLVDTPGGASTSTLDASESQSSSLMPSSESLKSRSILRKEVLKLIEQLGNPVLYKTCKQGLLQLKQICGDLFQDICLFSDVCLMLGSINYRIQARQLIQDLFLDAPFHELYEEVNEILNRTPTSQDSEDFKVVPAGGAVAEPFVPQQHDMKLPLTIRPSTGPLKEANGSTEIWSDERKCSGTNGSLEVIIEADVTSETARSNRGSLLKCPENTDEDPCDQVSSSVCSEETPPLPCSPMRDKFVVEERENNLYDCRRSYSYPATNYIITGFGMHEPRSDGESCACLTKIPATRSRSVSATCSNRRPIFHHRIDNVAFDSTPITGPLLFDRKFNLAAFSKPSLISFDERSSSVVLAFNPYEVLDLGPQIVIESAPRSNVFENDANVERNNEELRGHNASDVVTRRLKLASFESTDQSLLVKHKQNS